MVWCNVATVDRLQRPLLHLASNLGRRDWLDRYPLELVQADYLIHNPYVSLAYITDINKPVYVDCTAACGRGARSKSAYLGFIQKHAPASGI